MTKTASQINVKNIPPEVLKQAKKKAIDEGRSLSDVLRELLQAWATGEKVKQTQPTK
jgi:plasmid stability protein